MEGLEPLYGSADLDGNNGYTYIKDKFKLSEGLMHFVLKKSIPGIEDNHSYTVLGLRDEEYDGKEYHFMYIRNPHACNVRYDEIQDGKIETKIINDDSTDGVGRIEFSEFIKQAADNYFFVCGIANNKLQN